MKKKLLGLILCVALVLGMVEVSPARAAGEAGGTGEAADVLSGEGAGTGEAADVPSGEGAGTETSAPAASGGTVTAAPTADVPSGPSVTAGPTAEVPSGTAAATVSPTAVVPSESTAPPEETLQPTEAPTEVPDAIISISVADAPLELTFGSVLTTTQVVLKVEYADGSIGFVSPEVMSEFNGNVLGEQQVTFTYGGRSVMHTVKVVPRQVTGIKMDLGTATSMHIVWDKLEEAEGYEIYDSKDGVIYKFVTSVTANEYTFEDLVRGEIRYVKIRAYGGGVQGADSDPRQIAPKPGRVEKLVVKKTKPKKITIAWDAGEGATGYAVYYRAKGAEEYIFVASVDVLKFEVAGLAVATEYDFMVRSFAVDISNPGDDSDVLTYSTAPGIPTIKELKGGDKRLKVYWKKSTGAGKYSIYLSQKADGEFQEKGTVDSSATKIFPIDGLEQDVTYYVKVSAAMEYNGDTLSSTSDVVFATTKKAKKTSTSAKFYKNNKKFKKSPAYKNYKSFRKKVLLDKSFILPGLKVANVGGFNTTRMVMQSLAVAGDYLLISAYDASGAQESVIFIMDKSTRKYITTMVLPHKGHVGGLAYDGDNLWICYGKNLQSIKFDVISDAVEKGESFAEIYVLTTQIPVPDTASFVTYYKNRLWVGTYNEQSDKYMYGYKIGKKTGVPTLTFTNKMKLPNRTQSVAMTSKGELILSRSCQTGKTKRGYLCQIDVYKPKWDLTKEEISRKKLKNTVQMPPMNEGIVVSGAYTYLVFESPSFSECAEPVDRVVAFKTTSITKKDKTDKGK